MKPELRAVPEGIELSWTFLDETRMVPLSWGEAQAMRDELHSLCEERDYQDYLKKDLEA